MNIRLGNMFKNKRINRRSHPTAEPVGFPAFCRKKVAPRFELGDGSFAGFCLTTWLCHQGNIQPYTQKATISSSIENAFENAFSLDF